MCNKLQPRLYTLPVRSVPMYGYGGEGGCNRRRRDENGWKHILFVRTYRSFGFFFYLCYYYYHRRRHRTTII